MNISGVRTSLQGYLTLHSTFCTLHSSNFVRRWSVWMDSNHRPRAYQARALTTWATNRYSVLILPIFLTRVFSFPSRSFISISYEFRVMSYELLSSVAWKLGGDDGIRTHDPLLAGQVLSQLSYTPIPRALFFSRIISGPWKLNNKRSVRCLLCTDLVLTRMTVSWHTVPVSIERRWSSRTFRYGYLVTT